MTWIVLLITAIILASIIAGQSSAPSTTTTSQDCTDCKNDMAWYASLRPIKKAAFFAWYGFRWSVCKASGCI